MQEGDNITFKINNKIKNGKIVKIYTQIGMKNHGKTFAVIVLNQTKGLFGDSEIRIEINKINLL